ncbi:hypothetical protein Q765_19895 [Flavobacterium rivuli WB 3.3-2 = DSM 21788]|uniref:Uncharacterized protein n=1 Tax=Flavobacterium rivuli WB 3.3-2 = DSM 21788 TaxID=1121895 RepID=A0A0A2LZZ1_9FLAO|nr:hypothetical protein [Flavobacterium rivuli]KGO84773.1 hypothetical protein Q765_19895 [Flavobacterium rivuli WB 3.3-2 = DSM 21788]
MNLDKYSTEIIIAVIAAVAGGAFFIIKKSKRSNNKVIQRDIDISGDRGKVIGGDDNSTN